MHRISGVQGFVECMNMCSVIGWEGNKEVLWNFAGITMVPSQPTCSVTIDCSYLYLQPVQPVAFLEMEALLISTCGCNPLADLPLVEEKLVCFELARLRVFRALPSEMWKMNSS